MFWILLPLLCSLVRALAVDERMLALVVYDSRSYDIENIGQFDKEVKNVIDKLQNLDINLVYKGYNDEDLAILSSSEPIYDHLVLLPTSKKAIAAKSKFNQKTLMDFIDHNGNILVVDNVESALPDDIRAILNEVGIYPAPKNFRLVDHFESDGEAVQLTSQNLVPNSVVSSFESQSYYGTAASISNNRLLFPIVKATKNSITVDLGDEPITQDRTWTFGEQGFLSVGFQALNNARLAWVGAPSLVSDELIQWVFQEKNVLKLQFVQHYKDESPQNINPSLYRIKDQAIYTIGVSQYRNGEWVPYKIEDPSQQLQLSFKMLDPYQRLNLQPLGPAASTPQGPEDCFVYFTNFTVPDHHGMFTFELDHQRDGYTYLLDKRVVTVRHLANDEFKRSWDITNSWMYMTSASLVIVAWLLFVVNFLYVGSTDKVKKNV